ncbi:MAG: hypothetical protein BWY77_01225 [bacterium ADurb.Bin431]|nr:MAG: hypothetical protein BWY77_01225 [bacterium ADurb.Bin431]
MGEVRHTIPVAENIALNAGEERDGDEQGHQMLRLELDREDKKEEQGDHAVREEHGKGDEDGVDRS